MTERLRFLSALALSAALLGPSVAHATQYEVFVDIDDEEDLYDLQVAGEISSGTFDILLDLIRQGVDLNAATREQLYALPNLTYDEVDAILAYREEAGRIGNPAALVLAGALSRRKLESIAAFLLVPAPEGSKAGVRGHVKYQTIWTAEDDRAPPMQLSARVSTLRHLTVGAVAVLDRNRLENAVWDPNRDALVSQGPRTTPRLPKYFAQWDTPKWGVIAGTYNIGFGQRLTFDTTSRYTPNGFVLDDTINRRYQLTSECRESTGELAETPCPGDEPRRYVTPDYRERVRQRGVAVGAKHIDMPVGWMQAYGFFSHQTKPIYWTGVYNADACSDPRLSSELFEECSAPPVYLANGRNPLSPAPTLRYASLPNMYNEVVGGGNFAYFIDRRTHIGVTGYGSSVNWLVDGADLDFQEWQRTPYGGPFGAAGTDMSWGRKWADVFAEVSYSFDSITNEGGGGPAAIVRHTASWDTHEIEVSGRYYDEGFRNPYARPIAAADQSDGLRASDEAGGRLKYAGVIGERFQLRALFDAWQELSTNTAAIRTYARGDVRATPWLTPGLWLDFQSNDLSGRGRDRCFSSENVVTGVEGTEGVDLTELFESVDGDFSSYQDFLEGTELGCAGVRYQVRPRIRVDPHKRVNAQLQFQYSWVDRNRYEGRFSNDARVVGIVRVNPIDPLRLNLRISWDKDDISDDTYLQEVLWGYVQASYRFQTWLQPSLRYDIRAWLDDRASTAFRRPNPEHWVMLQVLSRF
ncbi:MAG: helix-hairpin-helix domain-containing protein [Nannocystaceae bacterium]|nr:helix-hairpin-helix domain-containing protein [Nannocystaceae bacterium]